MSLEQSRIEDIYRGAIAGVDGVIAMGQQAMVAAGVRHGEAIPLVSQPFVGFLQAIVENKAAFLDQIVVKAMLDHPETQSDEIPDEDPAND